MHQTKGLSAVTKDRVNDCKTTTLITHPTTITLNIKSLQKLTVNVMNMKKIRYLS